jgi:hypothetical protein
VLLPRLAVHSDEMPAAMELLALKLKVEMALRVALVSVADRRPGSAVPDDHRAPFAFRNRAFEAAIFERMVLDMDREAFLAGDKARAAGHSPALQHAIHLKPEIVMEPSRVMLLNHEARSGLG